MGILNRIRNGLAIAATAMGITPAVAQEASLHTQIETDNPQIAECAGEAFNAVQIDGAEAYYSEAFNSLVLRKSEEFASISELNPIRVNGMGVIVNVFEGATRFEGYHDGSLSELKDSVRAVITLTHDTDTVIERTGIVLTGWDITTDQALAAPHGAWTSAAAQTMENTYVECMGLENPNRFPGAASSVGQPPAFMSR